MAKQCIICKLLLDELQLKNHILEHLNFFQFSCRICEFRTNDFPSAREHREQSHPDEFDIFEMNADHSELIWNWKEFLGDIIFGATHGIQFNAFENKFIQLIGRVYAVSTDSRSGQSNQVSAAAGNAVAANLKETRVVPGGRRSATFSDHSTVRIADIFGEHPGDTKNEAKLTRKRGINDPLEIVNGSKMMRMIEKPKTNTEHGEADADIPKKMAVSAFKVKRRSAYVRRLLFQGKISLNGVPFELGEIVWAKVRAYPYWPAIIAKARHGSSIRVTKSGTEEVLVEFYGYDGLKIPKIAYTSMVKRFKRSNIRRYYHAGREFFHGCKKKNAAKKSVDWLKQSVKDAVDQYSAKTYNRSGESETESDAAAEPEEEWDSIKVGLPEDDDVGSLPHVSLASDGNDDEEKAEMEETEEEEEADEAENKNGKEAQPSTSAKDKVATRLLKPIPDETEKMKDKEAQPSTSATGQVSPRLLTPLHIMIG